MRVTVRVTVRVRDHKIKKSEMRISILLKTNTSTVRRRVRMSLIAKK